MKSTIIIPIFNEEKNIDMLMNNVTNLLASKNVEFNFIFVNDGSTDGTKTILEKIKNPYVKIIHHEKNNGYGASIKTGLREAFTEVICIIDADGTYDLLEIVNLVYRIKEGFSMIVGSRTGQSVTIPFVRRIPKWILRKLAIYLTESDIPDINSGMRVMKKCDMERFMKYLPDGFSFTTTITIAMLMNKLKVCFVPINYYPRKGKSKIRPIFDTINFFQLIIRTVLYFNPLRIFIPFSIFLVVLAFSLLLISWFIFGKAMDVTFGIIVMTSVIILAIGALADLINKKLE